MAADPEAAPGSPVAGLGLTAAVVAIAVSNVLGGVSYLWQKLALVGLPPITVILLRNIVALVAMAIMLAVSGNLRWPYDRQATWRLFIVGNVAFALPMVLGIVGVQWSTASNGSILILLEPASILFFSWLLLREFIHRLQVLGILVGLVGALLVVTETAPLEGLFTGQHLWGNVILASHGVLWGLYSPLIKPLLDTYGKPIQLTFASMLLACVSLVPAALFEHDQWQTGPHLAEALWWTLCLGLVVSFAATLLWNVSLTKLRSSTVAPFVFLQPLAGVLAGWFVLDETLTAEALVGGAVIGVGVALVLAPAYRRRRALRT